MVCPSPCRSSGWNIHQMSGFAALLATRSLPRSDWSYHKMTSFEDHLSTLRVWKPGNHMKHEQKWWRCDSPWHTSTEPLLRLTNHHLSRRRIHYPNHTSITIAARLCRQSSLYFHLWSWTPMFFLGKIPMFATKKTRSSSPCYPCNIMQSIKTRDAAWRTW